MTPPPPLARWFSRHERAATLASWVVILLAAPLFWLQEIYQRVAARSGDSSLREVRITLSEWHTTRKSPKRQFTA